MKERQFKVGDIVRLKSGSPNMTVAILGKLSSDDVYSGLFSCTCKWFNQSGNLYISPTYPYQYTSGFPTYSPNYSNEVGSHEFPEECLEIVKI